MSQETTTLYRPVGQAELDLIQKSGNRRFPPRLPSQPIFYPVLFEEYAIQIARDWNTNDPVSGFVGYVLKFRISNDYLDRYTPQVAGSSRVHVEYWIPAEDLENFNDNIVGPIEITHTFQKAPAE
jgi:hypothetical protein